MKPIKARRRFGRENEKVLILAFESIDIHPEYGNPYNAVMAVITDPHGELEVINLTDIRAEIPDGYDLG